MKKNICAILTLDKKTSATLEKVREIESFLCPLPHLGIFHISIACFFDIPESQLIRYTADFAKGQPKIPIRFDAVRLLSPSVIVCTISDNPALNCLYRDYHARFDEYSDPWTKLADGLWEPHCTLLIQEDTDLTLPLAEMERNFSPFNGWITGLQLSWLKPDGYETLAAHPFK